MPTYEITLSRTKQGIGQFQIDAPSIVHAHAAGQTVKRNVLAKEKHDSFGNPKIAEDICIVTKLLAE